jgi:hypothetical protein
MDICVRPWEWDGSTHKVSRQQAKREIEKGGREVMGREGMRRGGIALLRASFEARFVMRNGRIAKDGP